MDKQFWISIIRNDYALPGGSAILPLTDVLFSFLDSTDPILRDSISLEVFFHWLDRGLYSPEDVRGFIPRLLENLHKGLEDQESDSVFPRAFSILWLGLIVENDNKEPVLKREDLAPILEALLVYFDGERDYRGFVQDKGFAHAIAHAADLFSALACSPHTNGGEHLRILECIAAKLKAIPDWIFIYGEESRLATAVLKVFARETISRSQIETWLDSLSSDWDNSWCDRERALKFFNGRNFLRSLHYKLLSSEEVPDREPILKMLRRTLDQVNPVIMPDLD